MNKDGLLALVRGGGAMRRSDKLRLVWLLALPAMLGQLSTIAMQYIDAIMVGQLGASAAAAIGLVSTSTWLFGGGVATLGQGFAVVVAHRIGAKDFEGARSVMRQGAVVSMGAALLVSALCVGISGGLPVWLGGEADVCGLASGYFLVWALTLPVKQLMFFCNSMLRVSGEMRVPMLLGVVMLGLDVVFNLLFIPRWGVLGAALATSCACLVCATLSALHLFLRSPELALRGRPGRLRFDASVLREGLRIALPMGVEHVVFCGAQIASTVIVASLSTAAIAANAFGIVIESLCYMPGYGIGDAATALIGQSHGARRGDLIRSFAVLTVVLGVAVMTLLGVVMYVWAPELMSVMTPDASVRALGSVALRIEAFAEPMYAASIVAYCAFVGLGDTLMPCVMNLAGIWLVRIPLAYVLSQTMGLNGVWVAMCVELNVRGLIFLLRLKRKI